MRNGSRVVIAGLAEVKHITIASLGEGEYVAGTLLGSVAVGPKPGQRVAIALLENVGHIQRAALGEFSVVARALLNYRGLIVVAGLINCSEVSYTAL